MNYVANDLKVYIIIMRYARKSKKTKHHKLIIETECHRGECLHGLLNAAPLASIGCLPPIDQQAVPIAIMDTFQAG